KDVGKTGGLELRVGPGTGPVGIGGAAVDGRTQHGRGALFIVGDLGFGRFDAVRQVGDLGGGLILFVDDLAVDLDLVVDTVENRVLHRHAPSRLPTMHILPENSAI